VTTVVDVVNNKLAAILGGANHAIVAIPDYLPRNCNRDYRLMSARRRDFRPYDGLAYWVFRMGRVMHQDLASRLAKYDLNDRKLSVMMSIERSKMDTPTAIASYLDVDKAVIARTLRELERDGLVRLSQNSTDGRSRKIALTAAGQKRLARGIECAREMNESFARRMPTGQAEEIRNLFKRLSSGASDQLGAKPLLEVSFQQTLRGK
jgi:DNA-binding MarR family transcriptional regulator